MHTLTVYISDDCWSCEETNRILDEVAPQFPALAVVLVNTRQEPMPNGVFAVPTYTLNGKIISLGNPSRVLLTHKLAALFDTSPAPVEMDAK
jgi:hypothetical protein